MSFHKSWIIYFFMKPTQQRLFSRQIDLAAF